MLNRSTKYALRSLVRMAGLVEGQWLTVAELARTEKMPRKFLERVVLELNRGGLVVSRKGRLGGNRLAVAPDRITVSTVLRLMDGPLALVPCVSVTAYRRCTDCGSEEACCIRPVMKRARDAAAAVLDETTVADMVAEMGRTRAGATGRPPLPGRKKK